MYDLEMRKRMIDNPVRLGVIFSEFPFQYSPASLPDVGVTGIVMDNRRVLAGNLFVAVPGSSVDGHNYIADAIQRGASAIVGEKPDVNINIPYIRVDNSRRALSWLAAAFYGYPGRKLTVIGVTGTDGKTTTCNLLYQILKSSNIKAGLISTVNAVIGDEVLDTGFHVTTPEATDVQSYLARMVQSGLTHVVLETTSHGWAQYRVDACEFDIGVITNVTHEHLDQHGSYENYRQAKARLFQSLEQTLQKPQGNPRLSVLNKDDGSFEYLSRIAAQPQVSYGLAESADVRAEHIIYSPNGIQFDTVTDKLRVAVKSPLVGEFNVSNCLAALTTAIYGLKIDPEQAARGIFAMPGVPGRMERIDFGQPFTALVDFAHTPNALRVAINSIKTMAPEKRLIVIFGSAGLRDRQKRRMMAEIAAEAADFSILTAEDPRTESLDEILEEMADGARSKGGVEEKTFWRIPDRGNAIRFGINLARKGDVVVACGKGHEQSMCFGNVEYPWDDRTAMRAALAELTGKTGPRMPYLPTQGKQ